MSLPQRIAATTKEIPRDLREAAPGHRFQLYLENWQSGSYAPYKNFKPAKDERSAFDKECAGVLKNLCPLPLSSQNALAAIRARQQAVHAHYGTHALRINASSTAPFATGLGNVHPIENGFAFLTPYGLPYLAGSGVKGILRRAAEELALENDNQQPGQWTWVDLWSLFGFEGSVDKGSIWDGDSTSGRAFERDLAHSAANPDIYPLIAILFATDKKVGARYLDQAQQGSLQFLQSCLAGKSLRGGLQCRGALDFWDVFPEPKGDKLVVEIMTPHYGEYYRGDRPGKPGQSPHDSGAPVPVSFLAVPAGSAFDFHVVCHATRLPNGLRDSWKCLLGQAFEHAFDWVGFGAKTSVGYGAMQEDPEARKRKDAESLVAESAAQTQREQAEREALQASMTPAQRFIDDALRQRADKNQPELSCLMGLMKQSKVPDDARHDVALHLQRLLTTQKKWKEKTEKKNPEKDSDYQDTLLVKKWLGPT